MQRQLQVIVPILLVMVVVGAIRCIKKETKELKPQEERLVDRFKLGGHDVTVHFYDPMQNIHKKDPRYFRISSEAERLAFWREYVDNTVLYKFTVRDHHGDVVRYYCLRGNPVVARPGESLQLEVVEPKDLQFDDPITQEYKSKVLKRYVVRGVGGYLFEHMHLFQSPENRQLVEEGLLFHGDFFQVVQYASVKLPVFELIARDLGLE